MKTREGQPEQPVVCVVGGAWLLPCQSKRRPNTKDIVATPQYVAHEIVKRFAPAGVCLDPCRGNGVFQKLLPPGALWCELSEGVDFFEFRQRVDWIVGNPPYSVFHPWLMHSFTLADEIVYLIPLHKIFSGAKYLDAIADFGGIKAILHIGSATILPGFPVGFAIGAVHFSRGFKGDTRIGNLWAAGVDFPLQNPSPAEKGHNAKLCRKAEGDAP